MTDWYYLESGRAVGPFAVDDLKRLLNGAIISSETMVWNRSFGEHWRPLKNTEGASVITSAQPYPLGAGSSNGSPAATQSAHTARPGPRKPPLWWWLIITGPVWVIPLLALTISILFSAPGTPKNVSAPGTPKTDACDVTCWANAHLNNAGSLCSNQIEARAQGKMGWTTSAFSTRFPALRFEEGGTVVLSGAEARVDGVQYKYSCRVDRASQHFLSADISSPASIYLGDAPKEERSGVSPGIPMTKDQQAALSIQRRP